MRAYLPCIPHKHDNCQFRLVHVVKCAWQAANTVRRSNKKKKTATATTTTADGTRYGAFDIPFPPYAGLQPTVAQRRRGGKERCPSGRKTVVETCEDLSARRVRVGLVYENVTAVRWVLRPVLDESLQHLGYNSRSSTGACSALPDGIVNV